MSTANLHSSPLRQRNSAIVQNIRLNTIILTSIVRNYIIYNGAMITIEYWLQLKFFNHISDGTIINRYFINEYKL